MPSTDGAPSVVEPASAARRVETTPLATAVCVDVGSTFTKALHVDLLTGEVLGSASHPTTLPGRDGWTDVMEGYDACLAALAEQDERAATAEVLACSSAGGGLRIAVVGNEELVTAEAGRRVALSSGGTVVDVVAAADGARLDPAAAPDLVLLTGGTDGGNREVLLRAARELVADGWRGPVVVAGNSTAREELDAILAGVPHVHADNVMPRIGVLAPDGARAAIREAFLEHVIGGKQLSGRPQFAGTVRGATPDVVLTGAEVLARAVAEHEPDRRTGVVVVDIGGATTDVHSVVEPDPESAGCEVVATTPVTRTVEGDLGMRWSAVTTVEAAGRADLAEAARSRQETPGYLPDSAAEREIDEAIARAAALTALQRHAGRARVVVSPEGKVVERTGTDLREATLLVGSGGVLRHGRRGVAERVLGGLDTRDGWQLPERAAVVVDRDYVLAAVGLLAGVRPEAAYRLAQRLAVRTEG